MNYNKMYHQEQQQSQTLYPNLQQPQQQPIFVNMEPPPPYSQTSVPGHVYVEQQQETINVSPPSTTTTHVIAVQPVRLGLSPNPFQWTCTNCHATTLTETTSVPGLLTYLAAGTLFLCGCWAGCCLIPCCIPECLDVEHRCSNCKNEIGRYRRI